MSRSRIHHRRRRLSVASSVADATSVVAAVHICPRPLGVRCRPSVRDSTPTQCHEGMWRGTSSTYLVERSLHDVEASGGDCRDRAARKRQRRCHRSLSLSEGENAACVAVERAQSKDEICCKENLLRLLVPNDAREESGTVTHCLV